MVNSVIFLLPPYPRQVPSFLTDLPRIVAIPDIDNPTLEGALDETGYDEVIPLTNEKNASSFCGSDVHVTNRSMLMKPADGFDRGVLACPEVISFQSLSPHQN